MNRLRVLLIHRWRHLAVYMLSVYFVSETTLMRFCKLFCDIGTSEIFRKTIFILDTASSNALRSGIGSACSLALIGICGSHWRLAR